MIDISTEKVVAALDAAVEEKPKDYVYILPNGKPVTNGESCFYVHGDKPGCIVGTVLHNMGVPLEELSVYESVPAYDVVQHLISDGIVSGNMEAGRLLNCVQNRQDSGMTWHKAVRLAKDQIL